MSLVGYQNGGGVVPVAPYCPANQQWFEKSIPQETRIEQISRKNLFIDGLKKYPELQKHLSETDGSYRKEYVKQGAWFWQNPFTALGEVVKTMIDCATDVTCVSNYVKYLPKGTLDKAEYQAQCLTGVSLTAATKNPLFLGMCIPLSEATPVPQGNPFTTAFIPGWPHSSSDVAAIGGQQTVIAFVAAKQVYFEGFDGDVKIRSRFRIGFSSEEQVTECAIGTDGNGKSLVAYIRNGDVYACRLSGMTTAGNRFLVRSFTQVPESKPRAAFLSDGKMIVLWEDYSDLSGLGVRFQLFYWNTTKFGGEIQVNSAVTVGDQTEATIVPKSGNFTVVLRSVDNVMEFHFDNDGNSQGYNTIYSGGVEGAPTATWFGNQLHAFWNNATTVLGNVGNFVKGLGSGPKTTACQNAVRTVWKNGNQVIVDGSSIGNVGNNTKIACYPGTDEFVVISEANETVWGQQFNWVPPTQKPSTGSTGSTGTTKDKTTGTTGTSGTSGSTGEKPQTTNSVTTSNPPSQTTLFMPTDTVVQTSPEPSLPTTQTVPPNTIKPTSANPTKSQMTNTLKSAAATGKPIFVESSSRAGVEWWQIMAGILGFTCVVVAVSGTGFLIYVKKRNKKSSSVELNEYAYNSKKREKQTNYSAFSNNKSKEGSDESSRQYANLPKTMKDESMRQYANLPKTMKDESSKQYANFPKEVTNVGKDGDSSPEKSEEKVYYSTWNREDHSPTNSQEDDEPVQYQQFPPNEKDE